MPQIRERVIFIANRVGIVNEFPEPLVTKEHYKTVNDAILDLMDEPENIRFSHIITKHSTDIVNKIHELKQGDSLYEYSDAFRRVYSDKPSPTVKENHGGVAIHPTLDRVMTCRELARLQSFPDTFLFKGSKSAILKQIGNAVPPLMAKAIGLSVKSMLGGIK